MSFDLTDVTALIEESEPKLIWHNDGTLNLVFNPKASEGILSGLSVSFVVAKPMGDQYALGDGLSLDLSENLPSYISEHLESKSLSFGLPNCTFSFAFKGGKNSTARYFRKAFAEFVDQFQGIEVETNQNVVLISGTAQRICNLMITLSRPGVETFLTNRAQNRVLPSQEVESTVTPLVSKNLDQS